MSQRVWFVRGWRRLDVKSRRMASPSARRRCSGERLRARCTPARRLALVYPRSIRATAHAGCAGCWALGAATDLWPWPPFSSLPCGRPRRACRLACGSSAIELKHSRAAGLYMLAWLSCAGRRRSRPGGGRRRRGARRGRGRGKGKARARARARRGQGEGKAKARPRQGEGKAKARRGRDRQALLC